MKTAKKIYIHQIEIFDYLIDLEKEITGDSGTNLIEKHIFNDILQTKYARKYVPMLPSTSLGDILVIMFADMYRFKDILSRQSNTIQIYQYLKELSHFNLQVELVDKKTFNFALSALVSDVEEYLKEIEEQINSKGSSRIIKMPNSDLIDDIYTLYDEYENITTLELWEVLVSLILTPIAAISNNPNLFAMLASFKIELEENSKLKWAFIEMVNELE